VRTAENASAAYGIYANFIEAAGVVRAFNDAGIVNEHICLMLAPSHPIATVVRDANLLNEDRTASAITAGLIGWLSNFGAVVIPSVGFFIRSQAFVRALLLTRDAPALCGGSRTLVGFGFADLEAARLEAELQQGGFMVYIATVDKARLAWALELFRITGAEESAALQEEVVTQAVA